MLLDFEVWTQAVADARRHDPGECEFRPREQWENRVFVAANLRPVRTRGDKIELECRFYDREHAACRAYGRRPPMCSGYPWYGRDPEPGWAYRQCSYLLDVPPAERPAGSRPLIPLTVVTQA